MNNILIRVARSVRTIILCTLILEVITDGARVWRKKRPEKNIDEIMEKTL